MAKILGGWLADLRHPIDFIIMWYFATNNSQYEIWGYVYTEYLIIYGVTVGWKHQSKSMGT